MRQKWHLELLIPILALAVAIAPYLPYVSVLWGDLETDSPALLRRVWLVFGIQFAALSAAVLIRGILADVKLSNHHDKVLVALGEMRDKIDGARVRLIKDDEFYPEFLRCASLAAHYVDIAYLSPRPPEVSHHAKRDEYYREILHLMKTRTLVKFRRLVRETKENRGWVSNILAELESCPNVDLAVLREPVGEMPLALSVQIIDDKMTWLVAVATHENAGRYRDVYVSSNEFALAMREYYDRLWDRAVLLKSGGQITEKGLEYFTRKS